MVARGRARAHVQLIAAMARAPDVGGVWAALGDKRGSRGLRRACRACRARRARDDPAAWSVPASFEWPGDAAALRAADAVAAEAAPADGARRRRGGSTSARSDTAAAPCGRRDAAALLRAARAPATVPTPPAVVQRFVTAASARRPRVLAETVSGRAAARPAARPRGRAARPRSLATRTSAGSAS